jgi:hypothetical protein
LARRSAAFAIQCGRSRRPSRRDHSGRWWVLDEHPGQQRRLDFRRSGQPAIKLKTKGSVLDSILGYTVEDHVVHIHYYRPRGDNKEGWHNIEVTDFLGEKMRSRSISSTATQFLPRRW